ncbi:hypothetical protein BDZ91DRAFT_720306 [Kalaharituber pfeilii]|nr:hypothetical protein BDZ91DRAFT_720306 [Kalaharituber pfeilii]
MVSVESVWLAMHYFRKKEPREAEVAGRIVIASIAAGIICMTAGAAVILRGDAWAYRPDPRPQQFQHCSSLLTCKGHHIINALRPAFVHTKITPRALAAWPKEHLMPMSTLMKVYDSFLPGGEHENGNGVCAEARQGNVY